MKVLNFYVSLGGNTEKVASRIEKTVKSFGHEVDTVLFKEGIELDLLAYDFVFIGSGVYGGLPQSKLLEWLRQCMKSYKKAGHIRINSPKIEKKVVTYCTYAGYFTGESEAITTNRVLYTLFERLGFQLNGSWRIVGECKPVNMQELNVSGRLGDIRGRPDEHDLREVEEQVKGILAAS